MQRRAEETKNGKRANFNESEYNCEVLTTIPYIFQ